MINYCINEMFLWLKTLHLTVKATKDFKNT